MGAYGSPDTYPYEALNNNPGGKPPRPPRKESGHKPIWKRWWFWVNAIWVLLCLVSTEPTMQNWSGMIGGCCFFAIAYNAIRFLVHLWTGRPLMDPIICVVVAFGIIIAFGALAGNTDNVSVDAHSEQTVLTRDVYDQITQGMSYQEVCDLLGGDGVLYHESGFEQSNNDVEAYYWGTEKQNLYVGFLNGVVYDKGQTGLK